MKKYPGKCNPCRFSILIVLISLFSVLLWGCHSAQKSGATTNTNYRDAVSDFYISLAAEETDNALFAYNKMFEITKLYPNEPAVWADLGVMAMRQGNFDLAKKRLDKAMQLAPQNGDIAFMQGILNSQQGKINEAIHFFHQAAKLSPDNIRIQYALVLELERRNNAVDANEILGLLSDIRKSNSQNLVALLEQIRVATRYNQQKLLNSSMEALSVEAKKWPADIQSAYQELVRAVKKSDKQNITVSLTFLENALQSLPAYQRDQNDLQFPPEQIGFLITHFIKLPTPKSTAEPADTSMTFRQVPVAGFKNEKWIYAVSMGGEAIPHIMAGNGTMARFEDGSTYAFPGKAGIVPGPFAIATLDYNYDFMNDMAFAGDDGLKLYRQRTDSSFTDVTASLKLPSSVIHGNYTGIWAADLDLDGDLDLIVAPAKGKAIYLQNNGDGTFTKINGPDLTNLADFHWVDLDNDGAPDIVALDRSGTTHYYLNERQGKFQKLTAPVGADSTLGLTVADINGDARFDVISVLKNGEVMRSTYEPDSTGWISKSIARWNGVPPDVQPGQCRVFVQDIDNNGKPDLLISMNGITRMWLSTPDGKLKPMGKDITASVTALNDMNGNGRLDLVGLTKEGRPAIWFNHGEKNYKGEVIRPRASGPVGDRRINSYGIGGILEARSGLIYQKQLITSPEVHFGLGTYSQAEMLRVIWPNGSVQAEFSELGNSSTITNQQSLKGSCPWLFAYNGKKMKFITDVLWRSPLGLRINAQKSAGVSQTRDWVTIRGDQLRPRNGYYDVRITAELWETHFFDYVGLMAVDHPDSTHIFVDERFSIPPPVNKIYVTGPLHNVVSAHDNRNRNVTALIEKRDGKYLGGFGLTQYQGLAKPHYVDLDLGNHLPKTGPLWLIAYGWVYPTDSSINVAISQGREGAPQGIRVEIPDGHGGWKTALKDIGFPAGKNKTVLINLRKVFQHTGRHRIRLITTTETYWDAIWWARGLPHAKIDTLRELPERAVLKFRGYSKITQADKDSPSIPHYQQVVGYSPKWQDLVGYYTRYGDVRPLLRKVDDRYVIMNAGDEMRFRFAVPAGPKPGWKRDFVMISDGWEKDGDYNTTFSKTVLPLPSHSNPDYTTAPTRLQDDPVYQAHRSDWVKYQTRYVTAHPFYQALRVGLKRK